MWNPTLYGRYADERARPFFELVSRIGAEHPRQVVDLGCGTGELTVHLAQRWPDADLSGVDSSPEMLSKAPPGARFEVLDARAWKPAEPVDVIVSNALLQWIPEHRELITRWMAEDLAPGGWLAFQVPGNFDFPSHVLIRDLCQSAAWRDELGDLVRHAPVGDPGEYLDLLGGNEVDAWETTYQHVLQGEDAVLTWVRATALRPMLGRLTPDRQDEFLAEAGRLLGEAYPRRSYGTPFPFRRIFVVARKES
ncbi:putative trans-aconitate methyltransferase [Acrocarpospora pleiomorpha]|uniref:Putative trans-aconitate methyltransferase n=1 Tax=Acrocarpospora pleiomorpha TaxID=90975 RepID=A0A5M3XY84_9ACTN|nr:trans-aconitate 2-methyltransferase [Acrocarpospora pleiomorpha]GES25992.1 putative trans-aconitate methyltransferase [Acrocarpospora pleiomorpha]